MSVLNSQIIFPSLGVFVIGHSLRGLQPASQRDYHFFG